MNVLSFRISASSKQQEKTANIQPEEGHTKTQKINSTNVQEAPPPSTHSNLEHSRTLLLPLF